MPHLQGDDAQAHVRSEHPSWRVPARACIHAREHDAPVEWGQAVPRVQECSLAGMVAATGGEEEGDREEDAMMEKLEVGVRRRRTVAPAPMMVIGPSIAYIPLSKGLFALVDSSDAADLSRHIWHAHKEPTAGYYAVRNPKTRGAGSWYVWMHKEIVCTDLPHVDHKNHNTLDNRRGNLRGASAWENRMNNRVPRKNPTGFTGVRVDTRGKTVRYQAVIKVNKRPIQLGMFPTAEEAGAAYLSAYKKYANEFASMGILNGISRTGAKLEGTDG